MEQKRKERAIPGDVLAVIEEFEAGGGSYVDRDLVRSCRLGVPQFDLSKRIISVKSSPVNRNIPKIGEDVIAHVESVQSSVVGVRIYYMNGRPSTAGFTGMILLHGNGMRSERRGPPPQPCKAGDIVRAQVISLTNAVISLTVEPEHCGVILTSCSLCGSSVIRVRNRVKCTECGFVDFRKLASDFEKPSLK